MNKANQLTYSSGDVRIQESLGVLESPKGSAKLALVNMKVACYLLKHKGEVISRSTLMDAVWPNQEISDDTLTRAISDIRAALSQISPHTHIKTLPKRGYRWNVINEIKAQTELGTETTDEAILTKTTLTQDTLTKDTLTQATLTKAIPTETAVTEAIATKKPATCEATMASESSTIASQTPEINRANDGQNIAIKANLPANTDFIKNKRLNLRLIGFSLLFLTLTTLVGCSLIVWTFKQFATAPITRVAVLPVHVQDESLNVFANEFRNKIKAELIKAPQITVLSDTAMQAQLATPFPHYNKQYGIHRIIETQFRKRNGQLIIHCQYIDAKTATILGEIEKTIPLRSNHQIYGIETIVYELTQKSYFLKR